jgi:hypothetical protein
MLTQPVFSLQISRHTYGGHFQGLCDRWIHRWRFVRTCSCHPACIHPAVLIALVLHSVQKFLDIASQTDTDLSEQILSGPNEFSRVGRSQVQQQDGDEDRPATAASSEDVAAVLESLASMH